MVESIGKLPVTRRLLTIEEYDRMGAAGILNEDERVELIQGELVQMAAIGSPHASCVMRLTAWFTVRVAGRALVSVQNPIRLPPRSEPEPDLVILRHQSDFYATAHPGPEDVLLLIEVSDTTLVYDRGVKLPLYARAGIPEVWIVDLEGRRLLVHRQPSGMAYGEITVVAGGALSPAAFPDLSIRLDEIIG